MEDSIKLKLAQELIIWFNLMGIDKLDTRKVISSAYNKITKDLKSNINKSPNKEPIKTKKEKITKEEYDQHLQKLKVPKEEREKIINNLDSKKVWG